MSVRAFFKSVLAGTLVAGALPVIVALFFAGVGLFEQPFADGRSFLAFLVPVYVFAFVLGCVALGGLIFGLPGTWVLEKLQLTSKRNFMMLGGISAIRMAAALCALESMWDLVPAIAIFAVPGGIVAGRTWYLLCYENDG